MIHGHQVINALYIHNEKALPTIYFTELYDYQQTGSNVLFFTFVHPADMEVPYSFQKLAATRGTSAPGAVPAETIILFAIGGYTYSQQTNPWEWLSTK